VFDDEFGADLFAYLDARPELSALFNASMSQGTRPTAARSGPETSSPPYRKAATCT
jgi:hypothetical protein